MYRRKDGTSALNKGERGNMAKEEPLAGSQGRGNKDNTRERRGAQAEQEVSQRYSPRDFKLNKRKQLELAERTAGPGGAALACSGIANLTTTLTKVPLSAASTSIGADVTVDTDDDSIVLAPGNAYLITATHFFKNTDGSNNRQAHIAIAASSAAAASADALAYTNTSIEPSGRAFVDVSALVDNRGGAISSVQVRISGSTTDVDGLRGWASAVRI